jgi:hypothetical protein
MEATRLAPAGRACSKFVWQGRFLKTGRFECLCIRAALSFLQPLTYAARGSRIAQCRRWPWGFGGLAALSICASKTPSHFARRFDLSASKCALPVTLVLTRAFCRTQGGFPRRGLATLLPRLGVTSRGRNAADGRLTANHSWRASGVDFRWAGGAGFVSEFETKRDQ